MTIESSPCVLSIVLYSYYYLGRLGNKSNSTQHIEYKSFMSKIKEGGIGNELFRRDRKTC